MGGNDPGIAGSGGGTSGSAGSTDGGSGGSTSALYPAGPYGRAKGSVLQDMTFAGLRNPKAADYKATEANIENISFRNFYNPTADPGKTLALVVNASALWCSACQVQAETTMADYAYWHPKGVEFLETVFEDDNNNPAKLVHLEQWAKTYGFEFPTVLDPTLKLGAFFNKSASPFNMIIDTRTMTIVVAMEGVLDTSAGNKTLKELTGQ
jgi:hypothetical protein